MNTCKNIIVWVLCYAVKVPVTNIRTTLPREEVTKYCAMGQVYQSLTRGTSHIGFYRHSHTAYAMGLFKGITQVSITNLLTSNRELLIKTL